MMQTPFFTIIIPTRNRYETLFYAVKTVLEQKFESFELIISDNSDDDNLKNVCLIEAYFSDTRVKYIRPDSILAMSDHWEFALSHAQGKYVILFGDDDGLVMGALMKIYEIISITNEKIISWARVEYSWPDRIPSEYANTMVLPFGAKTGIIQSESFIKKILYNNADYRYLPMLYSAAISRDLILKLKLETGRVFNAWSPDIYSGYAFANLTQYFISIGYPFSINGVSSKSNGAAHSNNLDDNKDIRNDYIQLMQKSEIKLTPLLPLIFSNYYGIVEPLLQLSIHYPILKTYLTRKEIYKIFINNLKAVDADDKKEKEKIIIESCRGDSNLEKWVKAYLNKGKLEISQNELSSFYKKEGFYFGNLYLDAQKFGLTNVYDVAVFTANLFGDLKDKNFTKPIQPTFFERIKRAGGLIFKGQ